jgi:hypothetical protein
VLWPFVRLALNPAVLGYHARTATAIFNWYLYTYCITTACLFAGARLLPPPRHLVLELVAGSRIRGSGQDTKFPPRPINRTLSSNRA